mgnify:CR=1 FL=1
MLINKKDLQFIADGVLKRNAFNLRSFNLGIDDCKNGVYNANIKVYSCFSQEFYDLGWLSYFFTLN